jgi:hypothetical protein
MAIPEVAEVHRKTIESIMGTMECPKAFECYASGFQRLCEARPVTGDRLIECVADSQESCKFAVDFGVGRFCECSLRGFLLKTLHI